MVFGGWIINYTLNKSKNIKGDIMPNLVYNSLNISESHLVNKIVFTLAQLANSEDNFFKLTIQNNIYFHISQNGITNGAGWYIIVDNYGNPLYVGTADDLNNRLNSQDGTRDNFANPERTSDSTRNIIKKFKELGIISELFVVVISENDFRQNLEIDNPLSRLDRENIEKILSIYRSSILHPIFHRIRNL